MMCRQRAYQVPGTIYIMYIYIPACEYTATYSMYSHTCALTHWRGFLAIMFFDPSPVLASDLDGIYSIFLIGGMSLTLK